jgi:N-acetylneuraminate synthase/N,N'-diacetyllegionaminate synthase
MTGDRWAGRHGPLLVAEIGGNHEGDLAYARDLTAAAIEAGVDVVKFQVYYADDLVNPRESPDRHAHFRRFEFAPDQHLALAEQCRAGGVEYSASVWSPSAISWLDPYIAIYKVGSGDLTAYPLLDAFAATGKPLILSTGLSTIEDVVDAVTRVRQRDDRYQGREMLAVLQCTSTYPLPKDDVDLLSMDALREATGAAVGYSDHTTDARALVVAVARGADVLEFHFTDTREGKQFRDHFVSLTPDEVRALITDIEEVRLLLGDGGKRPRPSEVEAGHVESFRRAVYFRRDMVQGEVVMEGDLVLLRPLHGLDARRASEVVGRRLGRDVAALDRVDLDAFDVSPPSR